MYKTLLPKSVEVFNNQNPFSYPERHAVSLRKTMVKVQDHYGGDYTRCNHKHDAVEVGANQRTVRSDWDDLRDSVEENS